MLGQSVDAPSHHVVDGGRGGRFGHQRVEVAAFASEACVLHEEERVAVRAAGQSFSLLARGS